MSTTKVQWRVQVRKSRAHKWKSFGLYETRRNAREEAAFLRGCYIVGTNHTPGFGNTRVVRYGKDAK